MRSPGAPLDFAPGRIRTGSSTAGASFVGEVGYARLAAHPEVLDLLRTSAGMGHDATAMLFRCTGCATHLAYVDAS